MWWFDIPKVIFGEDSLDELEFQTAGAALQALAIAVPALLQGRARIVRRRIEESRLQGGRTIARGQVG